MRVRYYCHYGALTGYGRAARDYLAALHRTGVWLQIVPFKSTELTSPEPRYRHLDELVVAPDRAVPADVHVFHAQPRLLEALISSRQVLGARNVALTTWETSSMPSSFVAALERFDHVIVPSRFCVDAITHDPEAQVIDKHWLIARRVVGSSIRKFSIIPHCFDPVFWNPDDPRHVLIRPQDPRTRFYTIGAWGERKNPLGILRAYLSEFSSSDEVLLTMVLDGVDLTEVRSLIARSGLAPQEMPALSIPDTTLLTEDALRLLHAQHDVFVSATRGEGWGLGLFEAACMGKHVIAPTWGGQQEFLDDYQLAERILSTLTPCFGSETRGEIINGMQTSRVSMPPGMTCKQHWAEPDLSHIAIAMRDCHMNSSDRRRRESARDDRARLVQNYSYRTVGQMFETVLQEVIQ